MNQSHLGKLYLAIAFTLAGSSVVSARFISDFLPPFTITFFSLAFASLAAFATAGKGIVRAAPTFSAFRWKAILLQALFGSLLFRIFLTFGLQFTSAAAAGIITGAAPAITACFAWLLLREKLTATAIAGVFVSLLGILLVQGFPFSLSGADFHLLGGLLVLCAATCEAYFTTLSRKIHIATKQEADLSPLVQAGMVSTAAMFMCLIPMLLEHPWPKIAALPLSGWVALVWYGVVVTIIAFACMFAGAKRCSGYTIAAFTGIMPISSVLLAFVVLKEVIRAHQIAGCVLVVAATIIISHEQK